MVADLCLAVLLQGLALEDAVGEHAGRHPLLGSPEDAKRLHRAFTTGWIEMCEHVDASRGVARPDLVHCARLASLGVLGWASMLAAMPQAYRDEHGLGFERIVSSSLLRSSRLAEDAARDIVERGFLLKDAPNRQHGAARSALHGLLAAAAAGFRLEGPLSGFQAAMSTLMGAAFEEQAEASAHFWTSDYASHRRCFFVLHGWLAAFPMHLPELLGLLAGLAGPVHALDFVQAPLDTVVLPYSIIQNSADLAVDSEPGAATQVTLREPAYTEELALRAYGLLLPEWHLPRCTVLHAGSQGVLLGAGADGQVGALARKVQFRLEGSGLPTWRLALAAWDAVLAGLGCTTCAAPGAARALPPSATQLLLAVVQLFCRLLSAGPQALVALSEHLPADEQRAGDGVIARLFVSFLACAGLPGSAGQRALPTVLRALASCLAAPDAATQCSALMRLIEGAAHPRFRARGAGTFVSVLTSAVDREREAGCYPTTLAALDLFAALLRARPVELLALPGGGGGEAFGQLLDFTFGLCFARCGFWACRTPADRWGLSLACIGVASALMPLMECFNWPLPPELASADGGGAEDVAAATRGVGQLCASVGHLRAIQLRVLRSWSEAAFVPALLQCLACDVVFGAVPGQSGRRFIGFWSLAHADGSCTSDGVPEFGDVGPPPVSAVQLLAGALRCLHELLCLVLRPAGQSPQCASLAQHLLAVSTMREPADFSPGLLAARDGCPPRRADLVQSLYAHACGTAPAVARWAAGSLAALCALWHRAGAGALPPAEHGTVAAALGAAAPLRKTQLLALLAVPSAGPFGAPAEAGELVPGPAAPTGAGAGAPRPSPLASRLARRLLDVVGDPCEDTALRCAFAGLARAALAAQPGLFLDEAAELLPQAIAACARGAAAALAAWADLEVDAEPGRLLVALLALLDDLAAADATAFCRSFAQPVDGGPRKYGTVWALLSDLVPSAFEKWIPEASGGLLAGAGGGACRAAEPLIALSALLRLAERGCQASAKVQAEAPEAHAALMELMGALLGPVGIKLVLPPALTLEEGVGAAGHGADLADGSILVQHPFGSKAAQAVNLEGEANTVDSFLAHHQLRAELLGPAGAMPGQSGEPGPRGLLARRQGRDQLCEIACGPSADLAVGHVAARRLLRATLPQERLGCFGEFDGVTALHSGSQVLDEFCVSASLLPAHQPSVRFALAAVCGSEAQVEDVVGNCAALSAQKAIASARALAVEAFDDLVCTAMRQAMDGKDSAWASQAKPLLGSLLKSLVRLLYDLLQHLELLADHSAFFARLLSLVARTLTAQSWASALLGASPQATSTLDQDFGLAAGSSPVQEVPFVREMLERQTPMGLALVRRLTAVIRRFLAHATFETDKVQQDQTEVVTSTLPLLLLLVPALQPATREAEGPTEAEPVLLELLEALVGLVDDFGAGVRTAALDAAAAVLPDMAEPGLPPVARPVGQPRGLSKRRRLTVLRSPEEAAAQATARVQSAVMDHAEASGLVAAALAVVERTVVALGRRGGGHCRLGDRTLAILQRCVLPQLLGRSSLVVAPFPEHLRPRGHSQRPATVLAPSETTVRLAGWEQTSEAALACELGAALDGLLAVARSAGGAILLAEHKVFALLACSPLLHVAAMPAEASGRFPSAYSGPVAGAAGRGFDDPMGSAAPQGMAGAPWRRPLHTCWCQALLLVAALLASAPQLGTEAVVFLEAFAPRLRYIFCSGLQSGHMAVLEEASVACRVLALMRHRCGVAESILADAATQAFVFIVGACLSERSVPSEIFLPISEVERVAANIAPGSETSPAVVPSVFHQRVERIALELTRSLLAALLFASSSPTWLSHAAAAGGGALGSSAMASVPGGSWPSPGLGALGGLRPPARTAPGPRAVSDATGQLLWFTVMDAVLEGARRVVGIAEALQGRRQASLLLVSAPGAGGGPLVPFSLALVPLEPEGALAGPEAGSAADPTVSPDHLARGLQRQAPLQSPSGGPLGNPRAAASPSSAEPGGGTATTGAVEPQRSVRHRRMALYPGRCLGRQLAEGIVPECTSLEDLRQLCWTTVEMSCTLLCHFCQATQAGALAGRERSAAPGAAVLHSLLSLLHELCPKSGPRPFGISPATAEYLEALGASSLRCELGRGAAEGDAPPAAAPSLASLPGALAPQRAGREEEEDIWTGRSERAAWSALFLSSPLPGAGLLPR
ncbi:unnamed protein product [Prorocentrum cordatum]|uniref:Non-specific serine/threonine protein kinase n=1 Tax=Prorocentrum cordatum TaxID=2364126 RepID=A0ABN9VJG1_9DINO|nr:unnamed protein product [Polarella glacialis]